MAIRRANLAIGTWINLGLGVIFIAVAGALVGLVNYQMRQQALAEAEAKALLLLDRNLATHTYFTHTLKPKVSALTEPIRDPDLFDPSWMSSTFAVREIDRHFQALRASDYYYKEAAVNARSPENEADDFERAFLEAVNANPALETRAVVRTYDGNPYFVLLRRGEVMEEACLRCHSTAERAPGGLLNAYGRERSFDRRVGEVVSAISIRIPLASAYAGANRFSMRLSVWVVLGLACLFVGQYWLNRRLVLDPLAKVRDLALKVSSGGAGLGETLQIPVGRELKDLTVAVNAMSAGLRENRDRLEEMVGERTRDLERLTEKLRQDIAARERAEAALRTRTEQLEAVRAVHAEIARELDLRSLLELIIRRAVELTGAASGTVFLWDEGAQVLAPGAWHGFGEWRGRMRLRLGEGVAGSVAQRREGLIVNDYRISPYALPLVLERSRVTAVLSEPLLYRDRLVGVFVLDDHGTGRAFGEQDRAMLALFAAQAAIAIENARLYEATRQAARQARSLYAVAHSLTTSLEVAEVLQLIAMKTTELLGTPHAQVVLWDEASQSLRLGAAHGTEAEEVKTQQFRLGQGVNGIVAQTRAPLIVNGYQAYPHRREGMTKVMADIGVPLLYRGRLLGVLNSHATQPGWVFTEEDLALLTSFAAQAAIAIENARLYDTIQQHAAMLEARVRERTAELEEALEVKSLFLANMSHELRTPLNFILGFAEILRERTAGPLTAKQVAYVERIHKGGQRLLELVTDLLEMAEAQTGPASFQLDRVVPEEVLEEILDPLAVTAQAKAVALETTLDPGLPVLVADRRRFTQVLHHLLTNAIRFTPTGGRVTLGTRRISTAEGEEAEVTVADTGIGIRPEDCERIFRPFQQVDGSVTRPYGGAGLGLALVRRFVALHGGRVWAESDGEGRGARFIFRLPLLAAPPPPRVLVVEDEAPVREALCAALAATGYTVEGAATGAAALERLAASPPSMLVLDIGLPDMDGRELLRQIRAQGRTRALPVLVLTGLDSVPPDRILTLGADEFLTKPVSAQVLAGTIARLLREPVEKTPAEIRA